MTTPQTQARDHFNQSARNWDDKPMRVQIADSVAAVIAREIPLRSSMRALDFGCGTGLVGLALAPRLESVLGLDTAEEMVNTFNDKAREQHLDNARAVILEGEGESMRAAGLEENAFDLIFSSMTFHHIADTEALLRRLYALLRPGGHLAVADLDAEDGYFHAPGIPGIMHNGFDRHYLRGLFAQVGFHQARPLTIHVVNKQFDEGKTRDYPIFLLHGRK